MIIVISQICSLIAVTAIFSWAFYNKGYHVAMKECNDKINATLDKFDDDDPDWIKNNPSVDIVSQKYKLPSFGISDPLIGMSDEKYTELHDNQNSSLTKEEIDLGWHWCNEFDGMLVGPGMPEFEEICKQSGCIC